MKVFDTHYSPLIILWERSRIYFSRKIFYKFSIDILNRGHFIFSGKAHCLISFLSVKGKYNTIGNPLHFISEKDFEI